MGSVDEYIAGFPPEARQRLEAVRAVIGEVAPPGASETMAWRMPTVRAAGYRIHYAGYERHIGLYPGPEAIVAFAEQLAPYAQGKGSVQFPHTEPLPLELIRDLARSATKW